MMEANPLEKAEEDKQTSGAAAMATKLAVGFHLLHFDSYASPFNWVALNSSSSLPTSLKSPPLLFQTPVHAKTKTIEPVAINVCRSPKVKTRATLDEKKQNETSQFLAQEEILNLEVKESVEVLKNAAKSRKVSSDEVLSALSKIEKAKIDPSSFLDTLGGLKSPGRTWMLIYTAEKQLNGGRYFPLTAIQRFDAAAKRMENGVFLGPIGWLTFEGTFSWKNRILAFIFDRIRIKIGPLNPFEIGLGKNNDKEPDTKGPFFIWFYVDEEIAVARGRSGGTAFWCRCHRVLT